MHTFRKGFSFFEVILYIALFSLIATALLTFSWEVLSLTDKQRTEEAVFSDARFLTEKINTLIRRSAGVDQGSSILEDSDGKLVLLQLDTSDTITIDRENNQILFTESGGEAVPLHSPQSRVESLTFQTYGQAENGSEYVGYTLVLNALQNDTLAPLRFQVSTTVESGAFIPNSGL